MTKIFTVEKIVSNSHWGGNRIETISYHSTRESAERKIEKKRGEDKLSHEVNNYFINEHELIDE